MTNINLYEKEVSFQADRRRAAVELIKIISDLWYDKSIEIVLFRNQMINLNVSDIINLHEYAGEFVGKPISVFDSVEIAKAILTSDLPPSKLDIGKLTYEFHLEVFIFSVVKVQSIAASLKLLSVRKTSLTSIQLFFIFISC